MSEEMEGEVSGEEEVKEAKLLGWVDKEGWHGNPEDWVDARTFLERGKHVLPILKKNNDRLMGQLQETSGRVSSLEAELRATKSALDAIEADRAKGAKAEIEETRRELRAALAQAQKDGDFDRAAELTDELTQLNVQKVQVEEEAAERHRKEGGRPDPQNDPEIVAWYGRNPEYLKNARKMALANAVAMELRQAGNMVRGAAFLDLVAAEVERELGGGGRAGATKVASGNGGGGRGASSSGTAGQSYADLPSEAKSVCDRMAARLVGPDKVHKTLESWRKSYTAQYFKGE